MSNKKISQLTNTLNLTDSDEFAVVNGGETKAVTFSYLKRNFPNSYGSADTGNLYLVPETIVGASAGSTNLDTAPYNECGIIYLTWGGGIVGVHNLTLPDATNLSNTYRLIRFTCDNSVDANNEFYLTPKAGQTLDGSASAFQIDRNYEGIMVWSDGSNWIRIQTKS